MNTVKFYTNLAAIAGILGVGMFLGHSLGQGTSTTPQWIGGVLILLAAVLLGMSISSRRTVDSKKNNDKE